MYNPSSSNTGGRARSCTGCRQVKLACDARKTAPQPCSRCRSKGIQCKFDSNFKRIPMRKVAQEITNGIHQLAPTTTAASAAATTPAAVSASPARSPASSELYATPSITFTSNSDVKASLVEVQPSFHSSRSDGPWLNIAENDYYVNYTLGNVQLDPETVIDLFKHFESYYLQHALFLAPVKSLYALALKSTPLFWTIVLVAAREHDRHAVLYEQISVAHGILHSQITQIAIQTVEEIHSLLLLCLWPIPRIRQQYDPGWNNIGLAVNAAKQLGCHKRLPSDSIARAWRGMSDQTAGDVGQETLALTWIYCFQIGSRVAAPQGMPPPLATQEHRSIDRTVSSLGSILTGQQKAAIEVLELACQSTWEVDFVEDSRNRFSLIQMFDAQLDSVYKKYRSEWTSELDVELLASKLYLYGLLLTSSDAPNDDQQQSVNRQVILLRMQEAASTLIARMAQLGTVSVSEGYYPGGALTFYPKYFFMHLGMAAFSLFRYLASYQGITQQDTATVVNGLMEAHKIFQSFPEHRDMVKAAINLEMLAGLIRSGDDFNDVPLRELIVTNRLGASVMFDAVFWAAHQRNRNPMTGASPSPSTWVMMNDDPRQRLPMTPEQRAATSSGAGSSHHGTDDGQGLVQNMGGPWTGWDKYMNDFEVGIEQWSNDLLAQMDPSNQAQMYDTTSMSSIPTMGLGHNFQPGQ